MNSSARSLAQNRFYWGQVVPAAIEYLARRGQSAEPDGVHERLKARFLQGGSTAALSAREFARPSVARLSYAARRQANAQLAIPKPGMRVKDPKAIRAAKERGVCEWPVGPHAGPIDPAHITSRGAGGDDRATNLVSLCRHHHIEHHADRIHDWQLRLIVLKRQMQSAECKVQN